MTEILVQIRTYSEVLNEVQSEVSQLIRSEVKFVTLPSGETSLA